MFFLQQAIEVIQAKINKQRIFEILCNVISEQKLSFIYESTQNEFDLDLLSHLIECAIDTMIIKFKHDCFQHNPHINYLKLSPILKQSINLLCNKMDNVFDKTIQDNDDAAQPTINHNREMKEIISAVCNLLKCTFNLQFECMIYAEVTAIDKFIVEHIFRCLNFERLVQFAWACLDFVESTHKNVSNMNTDDLTVACDCLTQIIRIHFIFGESNNYFNTDKSHNFFNRLLETLYEIVRQHVASHSFVNKNQLKNLLNAHSEIEVAAQLLHAKAIFLGAFIENSFDDASNLNQNYSTMNSFEDAMRSLIVITMRSDLFYFFAVTPREIINSFEWHCDSSLHQTIDFQSVPIDCLNEIEIVEKFLKRYQNSPSIFSRTNSMND